MSAPETPSLKGKVEKWLSEQGYPLEMMVAKVFQDAGLRVTQAAYYTDPETGKAREVDVIVDRDGEWIDYFMFTFSIAIECKKSNKRPWVVFAAEPKHSSGSLLDIGWVGSKAGVALRRKLWMNTGIRTAAFHQWDGKRGYGVTEALTTGKDVPYQAIMSAAKYANDLAVKTDQRVWTPPDDRVVFGSLTHPVVVLDGELFEASLDESGELQVVETDEAVVYHRYPFAGVEQDHTLIRIVRLDALPRFVEQASEMVELLTDCEAELRHAYNETIKDTRIDYTRV